VNPHRLASAAAAVAMLVLTTLVPAQPAAASPAGNGALCTPREMADPANWLDCARRARNYGDATVSCLHGPDPVSPDSGPAGWFSTRPDASLDAVGGPHGLWTDYGVAGYALSTYDTGCGTAVTHPAAGMENSIAGGLFTAAAMVVAADNTWRAKADQPGKSLGFADGFVDDMSRKAFDSIFARFAAAALACVGIYLLWRARHGRMSEAVHTSVWALLVITIVTFIAAGPLAAVHATDKVGTTALTVTQDAFGPGPENTPADRCVLGPDACTDHRNMIDRASDTAVEALLYRAWCRAELGSSTSATAKEYCAELHDASAYTWGQVDDMKRDPSLRAGYVTDKNDEWVGTAAAIQQSDQEAYKNLQGTNGMDRIWDAGIALVSAVLYCLFDMAASLVIILGFIALRVCVIAAPAVGTVGLMLPLSGWMRRILNTAVTSLFNIATFGVLSSLYLSGVRTIFQSSEPGPVQTGFVGILGVALLLLLSPFSRVRHIITARQRPRAENGAENAHNGVVGSWLRDSLGGFVRQAAGHARAQADQPPTATTRPRPETTAGSAL
jgi:hypothetical protein